MNVAFIPVRGGSKSIPLKNIKPMCGKPLVYWTISAACDCDYIDKVIVSTDSAKIRETVENIRNSQNEKWDKIEVVDRSLASATDTASTEFVMLEFAEKHEFDNIVLIQATSPLLQASDLSKGFEKYSENGVDSVLSVVRQKRFHWELTSEGYARPSNYDVYNRPRRQEFAGYYVENGAFYITSKENLIASKNRVSGNIAISEMAEETFFEIDELSDWIIVEKMLSDRLVSKTSKKQIKLFLTDCDGCLTDGGMYYSENGDELKKFNTKDGMGLGILKGKNMLVGIVTGEDRELNRRRSEKLDLDVYICGCDDKLKAVSKECEKRGISLENVAYVGDDINDIELLEQVGLSFCPADAEKEVRGLVDVVLEKKGGDGAIREAIDYILGDYE